MPLWLVRHARPELRQGICYGWTDVRATEADTAATARLLARILPPAATVWTSPLARCQQLALSLNGLRPDLVPRIHIGLMEAGFGCWEGRSWDQLGAQAVDAWADHLWQHRPGGGEALRDVVARVSQLWRETWQHPAHPHVWLTHAGVLRIARLLSDGLEGPVVAARWPRDTLAFGSVVRLASARGDWSA